MSKNKKRHVDQKNQRERLSQEWTGEGGAEAVKKGRGWSGDVDHEESIKLKGGKERLKAAGKKEPSKGALRAHAAVTVEKLVKEYQGGFPWVKLEIKDHLKDIDRKLIKKRLGEKVNFYRKGVDMDQASYQVLPKFDDKVALEAADCALDKALEKYDPAGKAAFTTFYYQALDWELTNLHRSLSRGEPLIRNVKDVKYSNEDRIFIIFEPHEIEKLTKNEFRYIDIILKARGRLTDKVVAEIMKVEPRTIFNIKKSLQVKLRDWHENYRDWKKYFR